MESAVYKCNLVLAQWKATFFGNVSCKDGITSAVYSTGRGKLSRIEDSQLWTEPKVEALWEISAVLDVKRSVGFLAFRTCAFLLQWLKLYIFLKKK